jgi:endogenous inhibitor of DNA gyrase (YacG/DUF329 family)
MKTASEQAPAAQTSLARADDGIAGWSRAGRGKVKLACSSCGRELWRYPSQITGRPYCGYSCREADPEFRARRAWRRPNTVACDTCGTSFLRAPSAVLNRIYCSAECRRAARAVQVVACSNCGSSVERWPSELDGEHVYCSVACRAAAIVRVAGRLVACEQCGRVHWRWNSEERSRFCSGSCWGLYRWHWGISGVDRLLTGGPRAIQRWRGRWAARRAGRVGGRPRGYTDEQQARVIELLKRGDSERKAMYLAGVTRKQVQLIKQQAKLVP